MSKDFNLFRRSGRLCFQIMLKDCQSKKWAVNLLPGISLGHNHICLLAVGVEWLWGIVNIGWMQKKYADTQAQDRAKYHERNVSLGLTKKQSQLRWDGW